MRTSVSILAVSLAVAISAAIFPANAQNFKVKVNTDKEPVHAGKYTQTVESLSDYQCPEWFRDAKFGIWAHWGPQCQPEDGDWYARNMYIEGSGQNKYQMDVKGHPSEFGFKDWINLWKADKWDPERLIALYKDAGCKYFFAMANHHDNFDMFDSKYQPWNSVNMGPHKDILGTWEKICRREGLRFGVSVHAAHSWTFYETSRGHDTTGVYKGVPYDGYLTKADGKGKWWEGYDVQDLYEQRHALSKNNREWNWDPALVTTPDQAFCDKIYNRVADLINKYSPDIIYFDDTFLPLYPVSDAGLAITADFYNKSIAEHNGKNEAVVTGKVLTPEQKKCVVWDVERGVPPQIQELPWQTCTCIGSWHYDKHIYFNNGYKTPDDVIHMLVDVVSKNGNLLLNIPVKGDGTIDPTEEGIVREIGAWMKVNSESIYSTRPWKVFGEGPAAENLNPIRAQGFNEGRVRLTARDIRFNQKDGVLYVTMLGVPKEASVIKSLGRKTGLGVAEAPKNGRKSALREKKGIKSIELLGSGEAVRWRQDNDSLTIEAPQSAPCHEAVVYKVCFK